MEPVAFVPSEIKTLSPAETAIVDYSAGAGQAVVPAVSGKRAVCLGAIISLSAGTSIRFKSSGGTNKTALIFSDVAAEPFVIPFGTPWFETANGEGINVDVSGGIAGITFYYDYK